MTDITPTTETPEVSDLMAATFANERLTAEVTSLTTRLEAANTTAINARVTLRNEREAFAAVLVELAEDDQLATDTVVELLDRLGLKGPATQVKVTIELNVGVTLGGSVTVNIEVPWGTDDDNVVELLDEDELVEEFLSQQGISRWNAEVTNVDLDANSVNVERF